MHYFLKKLLDECKNPSFLHKITCIRLDHAGAVAKFYIYAFTLKDNVKHYNLPEIFYSFPKTLFIFKKLFSFHQNFNFYFDKSIWNSLKSFQKFHKFIYFKFTLNSSKSFRYFFKC